MINPKCVQHAHIQQGDETVNIENIIRAVPPTNSAIGESVETNMIDQEAQSPKSTHDGDLQVLSTIQKDLSPLPKKRNTISTDELFDAKRVKLDTKSLKTKRPGLTDEKYDETSYYFENGLRKVYPYFFTFTTFTKGRWVGEKILDVFAREFRAHPAEEYKRSIETGKLTVNYEKVPVDYRLKHNDLLANIVHRHEVPVSLQSITIVHMDEDIVVVNKPASIPVHPCGRYRHNTVVFILAKSHNLKNLRTIHRLDRLTSGLLIFGRTSKKARELEQQIRNRQVQKEYICRVEGRFPDGIIECNEPIQVVSYKIGVCRVSPNGKDCRTTFRRISEVGDCSIVLCKPLTGRMHQIRVHLQYLGYPIVNDPLYNHEVFGPSKGRGGDIGGKSDDQLINNLIKIHNAENWLGVEEGGDVLMENPLKCEIKTSVPNKDLIEIGAQNSKITSMVASITEAPPQTGHEEPIDPFDLNKTTYDPHCHECKVNYRDPNAKDLLMYLHAWKYKGVDWEYRTELPDWACKELIDYDTIDQ
ncbi:RNA pseudouridylate synthase domain-containing protein 2-like [Drosophila persimilis]|uniref:RNA pseudouridylate synthase domain-containing protein 2 n=1 Tax=Drosophila persimilis TaxID=7234 RepID=UPI000F08FEFC|nr:RNA pseudouridylate synthase domain-containing protein 2 [Drosophila persimilis]XP_026844500.1 RNA pseudouridylate synthase domain-containing protein 2 [Drosophila persimilis]XP_026844501.1 RNA pseudouridylate synthase domain-containing protein 2 [Drosophila persimilis]XP_026845057.1 RNA pseudouridylate synthase domain-containing protein 2-like [Drosophila persimilis]XP_026845058.1 RNA pseudouridylate synthase domain-containing protein 2-like [Drosophila persimilis]XP_026845059.1 RNA pseudo